MIVNRKRKILKQVVSHFTKSNDFNGILAAQLKGRFNLSEDKFKHNLHQLVKQGSITIAFDRYQENPHILRLPPLPIQKQIDLLSTEDFGSFCLYPTQRILNKRADIDEYLEKPFTRRLALGDAQLLPVFFELTVLEPYYRDPRYHFNYRDTGGSISVRDADYSSSDMHERDKVFLQTFGIGYDNNRQRVIVVYLRYLSNLSPEHQKIWEAQIAVRECKTNSDYANASLYGSWPEHHSVYQGVLTNMEERNKLCKLMNKPPLFRVLFSHDDRPAHFHPLLRPTRRSFSDFIQLFDKMLSENVNRDFFEGDIPLEEEKELENNRVEIIRKATLRLIGEWIKKHYRRKDGADVSSEVIVSMKRVRKLRQEPAHKITEDSYDTSLVKEQDQLVVDVFESLQKIRLILMSHPLNQNKYTPVEWLDGDKIVVF